MRPSHTRPHVRPNAFGLSVKRTRNDMLVRSSSHGGLARKFLTRRHADQYEKRPGQLPSGSVLWKKTMRSGSLGRRAQPVHFGLRTASSSVSSRRGNLRRSRFEAAHRRISAAPPPVSERVGVLPGTSYSIRSIGRRSCGYPRLEGRRNRSVRLSRSARRIHTGGQAFCRMAIIFYLRCGAV